MKDILNQWRDGLFNPPFFCFPKVLVADGEHIAHLGPRFESAQVRLRFEPADAFIVSLECVLVDNAGTEFARAALFGALDILMTYSKHPILNVHVIIEQMEIDAIDSNARAFRLAGRDSARKALDSSGLRQWAVLA